ncbi:MAG: hypothetical protein HRT99_03845, partial [Mycoplasmatales bacterium]|nr:hypothetical protein [Mycoplasmatales bacterium]
MKNTKRIGLVLSSIGIIATPIVTVISCGFNEKNSADDKSVDDKNKQILKLPTTEELLKKMNPNGLDGEGNFTLPKFDNIKVVSNKVTGYLNNGKITFNLTPKEGYTWKDGTNGTKTVVVNITNLDDNRSLKLKLPSSQALLAQMNPNGFDGEGNFTLPQFNNIKVVSNKVSGQLSNGDVTLTLTPSANYIWEEDGTNDAKTIVVNVNNLIDKSLILKMPTPRSLLAQMNPNG